VEGPFQQTIASPVTLRGTGLHSGRLEETTLRPAPAGAGIVFRRAGRREAIPASLGAVTGTTGCVTLGGESGVRTVEHLLSAAWALGIDNLEAEVSGGELPGMDGSALPFVRALQEAGSHSQSAPRRVLRVRAPTWVGAEQGWVVALPAPRFGAACLVSLLPPGPGDQAALYDPAQDRYEETIAPARTWGYERDAATLHERGLARGASLENTLVIGGAGFLNAPRFTNEAARHKVLDLLGDLALLGREIHGFVIAVRSGHSLHVALARALSAQGG
jgi:UDP-3-O-[3-hydroxymyristoyl] N-acetylglucosamine deacetylase